MYKALLLVSLLVSSLTVQAEYYTEVEFRYENIGNSYTQYNVLGTVHGGYRFRHRRHSKRFFQYHHPVQVYVSHHRRILTHSNSRWYNSITIRGIW